MGFESIVNAMEYCTQCGVKLPKNANYCGACGKKVFQKDTQRAVTPSPLENVSKSQRTETIVSAGTTGSVTPRILINLQRARRKSLLSDVQKDGLVLGTISQKFSDDREVVLAAVNQNADAIMFASPQAIKFISPTLKADRTFMAKVIKADSSALGYASPEIKADREIVLSAVKKFGLTLSFASHELKNDREVVLAALKQNPTAIMFASPELQAEFKKE